MSAGLILNALFFMSLAGALFASWRLVRPMPGPLEWAIAAVVFAIAFTQMSLGVEMGMPMGPVARIANTTLWLTGGVLMANGLRRFFGLRALWRPGLAFVAGLLVALAVAVFVLQSRRAQVLVATCGGVVMILAILVTLLRGVAVRGPGRWFSVVGFGLLLAVLLLRLVFFIDRGVPEAADLGRMDYLMVFAALPAALGAGLLGLVLMTIERLVAELRAARDRTEDASRAKTDFLMGIGHELRTPLNAILGFNQLLALDAANPLSARQAEYVQQIDRGGRHLLRLIEDTSDVGRIESGGLALRLEPLEVAVILREAAAVAMPACAAQGVTIQVEPAAGHVLADRVRARQVLGNLVSNAVKYNRPGGSVRLLSRPPRNGLLRIEVIDTGRGIPEARHAEVFLRGHRLGLETSSIEGMGLGLNIARQMTEAMGGRLGFTSLEGQGSTFWLTMPSADA